MDALLDYPALGRAWEKVRANGGGPGTDGVTLKQFAGHLQAWLWSLVTEVQSGTYRPQPLLSVTISKPGKKDRHLAIPSVRDRVLQTLVAQYLTPILEQEFEDISYGYRPGRSVDAAVRHVMRLRDRGYKWVVDADIRSYFDSITKTINSKATFSGLPGVQPQGVLAPAWLFHVKPAQHRGWTPGSPPGGSGPDVPAPRCGSWKGPGHSRRATP